MNSKDFKTIVDNCIANINSVLANKSREYSSKDNKLHNFEQAQKIMRCNTKEYALWGMFAKHLVSITDMVEKYEKYGILPDENMVEEKIGDGTNYFILLKACFYDDMIKKEKDKDKDIHVRKKAVVETMRKKIQPIYDWCNENMSVDPFWKTLDKELKKSDAESDIPFLQTMSKILIELNLPKVVKNKNNVFIGLAAIRDEILRGLFDDIENLKDGGYFETIKEDVNDKVKECPERAMSLTEILEKNQGAIANSMYQNPRKRLVVENLRKILKPLFVWLTDNNRFVDYEKIKGILNRAELEVDSVPDEFIKDVVVEIEKLDDVPIEMRDKGNEIIADILRPPLTKFKAGDEIVTIFCPAWGEKWIVSGDMNIATISVGIEDKEIYYHGLFNFVREKDCFKTKEEAQQECNNRNNTNACSKVEI